MKPLKFYSSLLYFYPESYRKNYGREMLRVFSQMYQEETQQGRAGMLFWSRIISDVAISGVGEHFDDLGKKGPRNYLGKTLRINDLNIIGAVLLLPFGLLLAIDFIGRVVQGDLIRYDRAFSATVSSTFLYRHPLLLWSVMVLAPILAVAINLVPFMRAIAKNRGKLTPNKVLSANPAAALIIMLGFFALLIIYGHDAIPCFIHGVFLGKLGDFGNLVSTCRRA